MKLKSILIGLLLSALIVVVGCGLQPGKSLAGQAVAGYSDAGCVKGEWWYELGDSTLKGEEGTSDMQGIVGCTTYNDQGQEKMENPWCPTQTVNKNGQQVYVGGSGTWQYCEKDVPMPTLACNTLNVYGQVGNTLYTSGGQIQGEMSWHKACQELGYSTAVTVLETMKDTYYSDNGCTKYLSNDTITQTLMPQSKATANPSKNFEGGYGKDCTPYQEGEGNNFWKRVVAGVDVVCCKVELVK